MANPTGKNQFGSGKSIRAPKTKEQLKAMSDRIAKADAKFKKNGGINTPKKTGKFRTTYGWAGGGK